MQSTIINGWSIHVEQDENDLLFYYRLNGKHIVSELEAGAGFNTEAEAFNEAKTQAANNPENGGY